MTRRGLVAVSLASFVVGLIVGALVVAVLVLFEPEPCTYADVQRYGDRCHEINTR